MKYMLFAMLFVFVNILVAQTNPTLIVKRTDQTITIDGSLSETAWKFADSVALKECASGSSPVQHTTAKVLWDASNLYVAVTAYDKDIWATLTTHDGNLYTEEADELFIDPDRDGKNYFEYEVNCRNATLDIFMPAPWSTGATGDLGWTSPNSVFKTVAHGTINNPGDIDTMLVIEEKIPFADLKTSSYTAQAPKDGTQYSVNIYRIDGRQTKEMSCFSPVGGNPSPDFHTPSRFGIFQFSDSLAHNPTLARLPRHARNASAIQLSVAYDRFANEIAVQYELSAPEPASVALYDFRGVCMAKTHGTAAAPHSALTLSVPSAFSCGTYFFCFTAGNATATVPVIVAR
jgi:hypothetical protein